MSGCGRRARLERAIQEGQHFDQFLRAYVDVIRNIYKRRARPGANSPCHTCALNPATDHWQGFEKTMMGLMDSIENETPFVCHENLPSGEDGWYVDPRKPPPPLCAGFEAVKDDPEAKTAPLKALASLPEFGRFLKKLRRKP